jgi:transposase
VREGIRVREITNDEGRRLLQIVRRSSGSVVRWRRAQMVLLSAQGMDVAQIAKVAFTSPDRVREVLHNFNDDGFDSLAPKYSGGRPPKFTLPERREIKKIALSRPVDHDLPFSTWSLTKLAEFLVAEGVVDDISHEGLRVLLREEGVSFQVIKTWKQSNDPDFEAKKNRVLELYDIADGKAKPKRGDPTVVICMDEFGPLNLLPRPGKAWAPKIIKGETPIKVEVVGVVVLVVEVVVVVGAVVLVLVKFGSVVVVVVCGDVELGGGSVTVSGEPSNTFPPSVDVVVVVVVVVPLPDLWSVVFEGEVTTLGVTAAPDAAVESVVVAATVVVVDEASVPAGSPVPVPDPVPEPDPPPVALGVATGRFGPCADGPVPLVLTGYNVMMAAPTTPTTTKAPTRRNVRRRRTTPGAASGSKDPYSCIYERAVSSGDRAPVSRSSFSMSPIRMDRHRLVHAILPEHHACSPNDIPPGAAPRPATSTRQRGRRGRRRRHGGRDGRCRRERGRSSRGVPNRHRRRRGSCRGRARLVRMEQERPAHGSQHQHHSGDPQSDPQLAEGVVLGLGGVLAMGPEVGPRRLLGSRCRRDAASFGAVVHSQDLLSSRSGMPLDASRGSGEM